ncbi:NADH-quinone oxidoreductase subunit N [Flammeovirga sp. MY04]|uniref:NADH-quinone oxidoreductase subunit N n=1 Tax=Flammeovirga sp. MY04 TaxID=1191459 RepID=UPI0008252159|nr:NADH-quinone oxidoreductase subunit N [Flammeovirga sp. MY04]ANQ48782.2 NADH-quinone oxidoreductase subunit N [Flammeovirga sp. MY04]
MELELSGKLDIILKSLPFLKSEIWIVLLIIGCIIIDLLPSNFNRRNLYLVALLGVCLDIIVLLFFVDANSSTFTSFTIVNSAWTVKTRVLLDVCSILFYYFLWSNKTKYDDHNQKVSGESEWVALSLGMLLGGHTLIVSNDFIFAILALELISLPSYILTAFKNNKVCTEAAIKYFLFGAVSTAITIYGVSLIYGISSAIDLVSLQNPPVQNSLLYSIGLILITIGFLFKLAGFPMHIWVPDVYETAPIEAVALFSTLPKVAAAVFLFRFFENIDITQNNFLSYFILITAIASMFVGNLSALYQKGLRRLMGYSSIAHAGFILIACLNTQEISYNALFYFLCTYVIANFAFFFFINEIEVQKGNDYITSLKGTGWTNSSLAWGPAIVVVVISLIGLPPAAGFTAKLLIFTSLWEVYQMNGDTFYMIVMMLGLLNTAISIAYYIKIPFSIYYRKGSSELAISSLSKPIIFILGLGLFILFVAPAILL